MKGWLQAGAGAALVTVGAVQTGNAWRDLTCLAIGAALVLLAVLRVELRILPATLFSLAVLSLTPSAAGEQSSVVGVAVLGLFLAVAAVSGLVTPRPRPVIATRFLAPLLLVAAYWILVWARAALDPRAQAGTTLEYRNVALAFSIACLAVAFAFGNRDLVRDCARLFVAAVGVLGAAWWISLPTFFLTSPAVVPRAGLEEWRPLFVYYRWNPLTITTSQGFFGLPRASMISGESGSWAIYCLVAVAAGLLVFSGRTRTLLVGAAVLGIVSSQSSGAFIVVFAAALTVGFVAALRGAKIPPSLFMVVLAGLALFLPLVQVLFELKAAENAVSFTDRGFATGSLSLTGAFNGSRINLLAAFSVDGAVAALPLLALAVLLVRLVREPLVLGPLLSVALIGVVLQPLGFHVAAWVLLVVVAGLSAGGRVDGRPDDRRAKCPKPGSIPDQSVLKFEPSRGA